MVLFYENIKHHFSKKMLMHYLKFYLQDFINNETKVSIFYYFFC